MAVCSCMEIIMIYNLICSKSPFSLLSVDPVVEGARRHEEHHSKEKDAME